MGAATSKLCIGLTALVLGAAIARPAGACDDVRHGLPVTRIVEIDAAAGPLYGSITTQVKEPGFLAPKEVVLTFDDGPMPHVTRPILDTLDRFCTKATFFYIGKMAVAYPQVVREVMGRGHTIGAHTWSHPNNLRRLSLASASDQIERGFAALTLAAGTPIAPFFRFPGLSDSAAMLGYLQTRGIATFSVDAISNDSYIRDPGRLVERTLAQVELHNGGIVLFHDIKPVTVRALPAILGALRERGYKVVHLRPKQPYAPQPEATAWVEQEAARSIAWRNDRARMATALSQARVATPESGISVTQISAQLRDRGGAPVEAGLRRVAERSDARRSPRKRRVAARQVRQAQPPLGASIPSWTTRLDRQLRESGG